MIINKLELDSFGKFKDYKLELVAGVNLIYGENESGKSTIHSFIEGIFYGFLKPFTKKTIYSEKHERYNPLNLDLYRGNLEFKIDDIIYRVERDFKKASEDTRIYVKSTGENITNRASDLSAGKVVQPGIYFFDLSDIVFKNTVFISQQGIYTDKKLADEVRDRLVNVVTAQDENISVSKAIDILDSELKEIGTERAYTSKYGLLVKQLIDRKIELKEIQQKRNLYKEWFEKAEEINIKRDHLNIDILKQEELLNQFSLNKRLIRFNEAADLEKEIKLLDKEISNLNIYRNIDLDEYSKAEYLDYDIKNLSLQVNNIKSELEDIENLKNNIRVLNDSQIEEINTIIDDGFKVKYIQEKIEKNVPLGIEGEIKKNVRTSKIVTGLLSVFYLLLVFYFIGIKKYILLVATQLILLVIALLLFRLNLHIDSLRLLNNNEVFKKDIIDIISKHGILTIEDFIVELEYASNKRAEIDKNNTDLIKLNDRIKIGEDNLKKIEKIFLDKKKSLAMILKINNQKSLEDFKKSKLGRIRFNEIQKELSELNKDFNKILNGKTMEDIKTSKAAIKDFGVDLEDIDEEKIRDNLKSLKSKLESLSLDYKETEVQIKNIVDQISKEASVDEEIFSLELKINHLDKKKRSVEYATNRIKELSTDIHRDYAPIINKKVGLMVNEITNGKYKSVKIDKNLNISLQSKDSNRLLTFDKLSAGTIDQIYFSLRMGLTEEIIDKNLPLILDECFSQYDDLRLESILKFLIQKEEKRQIIIFTCHNREKRILDNLGIKYNYINLSDQV